MRFCPDLLRQRMLPALSGNSGRPDLRMAVAALAYYYSGLIGNALLLSIGRSHLFGVIRKLPAGSRDLWWSEFLRLASPLIGVVRQTACESSLGGVAIPSGSVVIAATGSAHRDPAKFQDPDEFRLDRVAPSLLPIILPNSAVDQIASTAAQAVLEALIQDFHHLRINGTVRFRHPAELSFCPRELPVVAGSLLD